MSVYVLDHMSFKFRMKKSAFASNIKLILTQYDSFKVIVSMIDRSLDLLVGLERTGALRLLVSLLDGDMFISELIRRHDNQGIASQPALEKTRTALVEMGLIEEREVFNEVTRKTRLYLGLTEKGKEVSEGIQKVALILSK
jgi:DNA-binding HxlR family transcriptional regulator